MHGCAGTMEGDVGDTQGRGGRIYLKRCSPRLPGSGGNMVYTESLYVPSVGLAGHSDTRKGMKTYHAIFWGKGGFSLVAWEYSGKTKKRSVPGGYQGHLSEFGFIVCVL